MKSDYDKYDIEKCISSLNIKKNDVVYISGNLINFGKPNPKILSNLVNIFYASIQKKIKNKGTIVVPSHSFDLVKNKDVFDPKKTLSDTGAFSNYILKLKGAIRQEHPYSSSAAIGKMAKYICNNNTQNVYGIDSPFERMINLNAKFISLGIDINKNCSQVHHAEYMMNVPYRYNKEFLHKVKINNKIKKKKFNLFVLYKKFINLKRDENSKIVNNFLKKNKLQKVKLGKNYVYCYNLKNFYDSNINLLRKDIYCWMKKKPKKILF